MKFFRLSFLALCLTTGFVAPAAAQTESELQTLYLGVLEQIGITGRVDSDGDVQFEYEDHSYFLEVNEDDPEFFRLVLPNIWPIESELERLKVLKAVNEVNQTKKVVKAYTVNDNVWLGVEMFISKPDDFLGSLERQFQVLEQEIEVFVDAMK